MSSGRIWTDWDWSPQFPDEKIGLGRGWVTCLGHRAVDAMVGSPPFQLTGFCRSPPGKFLLLRLQGTGTHRGTVRARGDGEGAQKDFSGGTAFSISECKCSSAGPASPPAPSGGAFSAPTLAIPGPMTPGLPFKPPERQTLSARHAFWLKEAQALPQAILGILFWGEGGHMV